MHISTISSVILTAALPVAAQLSGQATTTRYGGGSGSACGCGVNGSWEWQLGMGPGIYTAAGSQALFDPSGSSWCGSGCGSCYQLSSTGTSATGGDGAPGQSIIVMVTNLCPNAGNEQWCPNPGSTNAYGFSYHFDIMANGIVFGDNIIVNFNQIDCPSVATSNWASCQCASMVTPPTVNQSGNSTGSSGATTSITSSAAQQPSGSTGACNSS